jgi:pyocin large subunit-like protein
VTGAPRWVSNGVLRGHFVKHGQKFPYSKIDEYEESAIETAVSGVRFTYHDPKNGDPRVGCYEKATNRFTALTDDGLYIVTHFPPDRGEQYCRSLPATTYT